MCRHRKNKKNAFEDKSDRQGLGLSKLGYHFLAGVLKHARALTAFSAPSVNSYKRLVVGEACLAPLGPQLMSPMEIIIGVQW